MNRLLFKYYQLKAVFAAFSFLRVCNFLGLILSYVLSRIVRRPIVLGKPYAISVEPAGYCNLRCPECPTGAAVLTRKGGRLDLGLYERMIEQFSAHLMHVNLFFQGEPLLNTAINEMIAFASQKRIYSLLSTNGQLFNEEMAKGMVVAQLKEIVFSVDGLTQETYEIYRVGGKLAKLVAAVGMLVAEKEKSKSVYPLITLQFIVFEHNQHEVGLLESFSQQLGADRYVVKTAQFNAFGDGTVKPPQDKRWQRYDEDKQFRASFYQHCWRQWSSCVIGWDGTVVPCCYDKDGDFAFGNLARQPLTGIWHGMAAQSFRTRILNSKYAIPICKNCPEGRGLC
ncbi:MAG: radical SAM/SPASM domain-containing protein [Breznakibacter sp.]